jgi:hypothetical protein
MNTKNATSANDDARPDLASTLARLESEALHVSALADALTIIQCALPCLKGTEAPHEKTAFHTLASMLDLLCERASLVCEIGAEAHLIATNPARVAA